MARQWCVAATHISPPAGQLLRGCRHALSNTSVLSSPVLTHSPVDHLFETASVLAWRPSQCERTNQAGQVPHP